MKNKIRKSAAELAHEDMVREIPQRQIDAELNAALTKAKLWYALHGKKFWMPSEQLAEKR